MREYVCDLHIHTCLSPCASLDMSPRRIVAEAIRMGIDVIGITDHNSAENVAAVSQVADQVLTVLAGLEVTSREEVHILALYDDLEAALDLQVLVYENLPGKNDEDIFGIQPIVNADDEVEGFSERLLIGATTLPFEEIVENIRRGGGLAIAAHVDREAFGVIGQLGFVPPDVELDGLEVSKARTREEGLKEYSQDGRYAIIRSSDAHRPEDIGAVTTTFFLEAPVCVEIGMGLRNEAGRRVVA
ncbi:MAG: PHP domain-containing protein [Candidatus Latescibacteria bacterium]|nr:PHP domain-containing protein [Candidatus Latescibacterota bacterium]